MDADEIKELKAAREASLLEKWAGGKKMTDEELAEIAYLVTSKSEGKSKGKTKWEKNKVDAAAALGISRPTFDQVLKLPGCPPRKANGWYNVTAISNFMGTAGFRAGIANRTDDHASDKRKKDRFEALMAELEYEKATYSLIHIDIVERVVGNALEALRNRIRENTRLTDEEKAEMLKQLADAARETFIKEAKGDNGEAVE